MPAINPSRGPAAGGTLVTFTGTGVTKVKSITFADQPATDVELDANKGTITAKTPGHAAGDVDVVVTDDATNNMVKLKYKYEA
jgi:HSP20 family molecular chaperone IbpA